MKKKIIILEHGGGRLGNQLWNFIAIFAYAKERQYDISNHSFTDYYEYFNMIPPNWVIKFLSKEKIRNNKFLVFTRPYRKYIDIIKKTFPNQIIDSGDLYQFYLPPSTFRAEKHQKQIEEFEKNKIKTLYTKGWMFRNPIGIQKWRKEIIQYFRPSKITEKNIYNFITNLRKNYRHIIGVHIRQGDYKTWKNMNGKSLYFEQGEVRKILDEYLDFAEINSKETVFVLCSDGKINGEQFKGLNIVMKHGTPVEDIFTLSATDCILGSDSTFGGFASYYGNIPFIIFERPVVDWDYYRSKKGYFENNKSTVIFY